MAEFTPMMRQYFEIKEQYKDTILMYRLGDFYEMFFEDAEIASRELELVLTGRNCGQEERAPMCGVPFHSADSYIAKLVSRGYKVAICEQTEDPELAKGLVQRDVIRVITPGTVIESNMLDESKNNFLCCMTCDGSSAGICFADISTGTVSLTQLGDPDIDGKIINELAKFSPSEILYNDGITGRVKIRDFISQRMDVMAQKLDEDRTDFETCCQTVRRQFKEENLGELDLATPNQAVIALGALLDYLRDVEKNDLSNIQSVDFFNDEQFLKIDASSRRNLELCETMRSKEKKGSLLWVLDNTRTPMGKRLLRSWVERPLMNIPRIIKRQNAVGELCDNSVLRNDEMIFLAGVQDIERMLTRIVYGTANARELRGLYATIRYLPRIKEVIENCNSAYLKELYGGIDTLDDIGGMIDSAIVEEPPFSVREGELIKDGYDQELDELRIIVRDSKKFLAKIENDEQQKTGIKKLKIGYNRVFGYYIEVSKSFIECVPDTYIRKQTLANCERFITQELKELESKILGANDRIVKLEYEIFNMIREKTAAEYLRIKHTASAVAQLDALCSLAHTAALNNYTCPEMCAEGVIDIKDGRHPVVENMLKDTPFVPNDTLLDCDENRCQVITGPNMAGKSTYMRQVALIVLMAHMGSFVPASYARIGLVDSIFTRVGASDDLAAGQSTFMVEMNEVASILRSATGKSLIIFDEIGRGTSTFDGMSIARAVLEYAVDKKTLGAKTLFATHYHELTELENVSKGIKNYNIAVKKRGDDITFLRRIVRGGADGSYGIEVAKLAGVPDPVVNRAKKCLREMEKTAVRPTVSTEYAEPEEEPAQTSFASNADTAIADKIRLLDLNTLTPIEALTFLYELKKDSGSV
ncbi:MAG: DNA mismatch repair protein MutS [Clostridiales bacterium]|nr:DNA mismatch repair protein MutS [Clostridiales bacterium]